MTAGRKTWLLALAYGFTIANLYYCQPLLPVMAQSFPEVSLLPAVGQLGYVVALVTVVPLGDIVRRRRLVWLLLSVEAGALAVTAAASSGTQLLVAGFVIGLCSAGVINVLIPYAAGLSSSDRRGRVMGTMLTGGLAGVLLSRTVAGTVSGLTGWRALFAVAAAITVVIAVCLGRSMDAEPPEINRGYRAQLRETVLLARSEPVLIWRSVTGACVFGAFAAFWATIAYRLAAPPFGYSEVQIGLFALAGVAGALGARLLGRAADRGWQLALTKVALVLGIGSFAVIWAAGAYLPLLIAGAIVMDLAVQGTHLLNLSVVYGLVDGARSRVASTYMTIYTVGGVIGATIGTLAFRLGGWAALCWLGAVFMAAGLIATYQSKEPSASETSHPR